MKRSGFVLMVVMMTLAISTTVVTQIFYQGHLYNMFIPIMIEKEKARKIALAGVSVAIAQLSLHDTKLVKPVDKDDKKSDKEDPKKEKDTYAKNLLKTLLIVQNRWQSFILTHEADGLDAQLDVCITCEDGKLNINQMYDFKKHEFTSVPFASPKDFFEFIGTATKPFTKNKNMFEGLAEFLKKREDPLIDVTQLLQGKGLDEFKDFVFYVPAEASAIDSKDKKESSDKKPSLYLADLFTVDTKTYRLNPWALSHSVQLLLKIKPRIMSSEESYKKEIEEVIEKIPSLDAISVSRDWDTYMKPFYNIDFQSLPKEVVPFLSTKFEPRLFSVLCYGKVGRITQKLLVLLERASTDAGESISVKKMYWL